jgi:transposase InsO family protein
VRAAGPVRRAGWGNRLEETPGTAPQPDPYTEHRTGEGKLYCCVVLDAYSRRVVGWSIDRRCETALVNDALSMASESRATTDQSVIHSDHGSQGTLVIDATSFDTKNKKRDDHLRSGDFLEAIKYPTITFTATSGRVVGSDRVEVTGELTVRGRHSP